MADPAETDRLPVLYCLFANLSCLLLAVVYVASLYVWKSNLSRNHPSVIKKRCASAVAASLFAPLYLWAYGYYYSSQFQDVTGFWCYLGLRTDSLLTAALLPLILTMVAFLGPLTSLFIDWRENGWKPPDDVQEYGDLTLILLRNYVMAPLTEEFVFRACMLPLLYPCLQFSYSVIVCPLFFGVAHIHHVIERYRQTRDSHATIWLQAVFQMSYTSVFGAYSAFLFLRTGHLIGVVVVHSFCNLMGFPAFHEIPHYKLSRKCWVITMYLLGLIAFIYLVFPLTQPTLFANHLYADF